MLHGIILSFGGIPLIYAGDEIATLNDYSFFQDKNNKADSRWVNRPYHNWEVADGIKDKKSPQARVFLTLKKLIALRKKHSFFADTNNLELMHTGNEHVLVFERKDENKNGVLVLCNFNVTNEVIDAGLMAKLGYLKKQEYKDLISNKKTKLNSGFLALKPFELLWLEKIDND